MVYSDTVLNTVVTRDMLRQLSSVNEDMMEALIGAVRQMY